MQKISVLIFFLLLLVLPGKGQQGTIVPKPFFTAPGEGYFTFTPGTIIHTDTACLPAARYLQTYLDSFYHVRLLVRINSTEKSLMNSIILVASPAAGEKEGYRLLVTPQNIRVSGEPAGVFYGIQSLIQLLPVTTSTAIRIQGVTVLDKPRFAWRGLSLDVSRHFFSVPEVKKYLDIMAHYKLNRFHWHLTDDEGWRIQIDQYPLLTSVGSKMNTWAAEKKFRPLSNISDGGTQGFYTKADIREIVQYAKDRYISVLPEIEMPGHAGAAVYTYPWLGCADSTGQTQKAHPWSTPGMYDASEKTFTFLDSVLLEVIDLFPFEYLHIGGDEAEMKNWLKSPAAVALMKKEGLQNEKEIQSYFIKRMEKFLLAHNRRLMGWDEILEGGLAPTATVMSWRGEEGGIAAAKMGHHVVMTPLPDVYFDAPQSDDTTEPIGWNYPLSWQQVYAYNPIPKVLTSAESKLVMGVQGNIWAEKIPSDEHLEYMVYPRAIAMAEDAWTAQDKKNLGSFTKRLDKQFQLLHLWQVAARMPDLAGLQTVSTNLKETIVSLSYPVSGTKIFYTVDGQKPDTNKRIYKGPFRINFTNSDSMILRTLVISAISNQQRYQHCMIRKISIPVPFQKRVGKGIRYSLYEKQLHPDSLGKERPLSIRMLQKVSLPPDSSGIPFHTAFITGDLHVIKAGRFRFGIPSDGETLFKLNGKKVIDNEGYHGTSVREAILTLTPGYYPFSIWYGNEDDGKSLSIQVSPSAGAEYQIR